MSKYQTETGFYVGAKPTEEIDNGFKIKKRIFQIVQRESFKKKDGTEVNKENYLEFNLWKDKVTEVDMLQKDQEITVEFYIKGKNAKSKDGLKKYHFLSLNVTNIVIGAQQPAPAPEGPYVAQEPPLEVDDDLPF